VDDAEILHKQAYSIRLKNLGESHPDVALSLYRLARIHVIKRRIPEARKSFEDSLTILTTRLGSNHPDAQLVQTEFDYFQKFQENSDDKQRALIEKPDDMPGATTGGWAVVALGVLTTGAYFFFKNR